MWLSGCPRQSLTRQTNERNAPRYLMALWTMRCMLAKGRSKWRTRFMMIRYSPCNLAPGVHLPLHRLDFKKLTTELERRFVDPRKFKDGWRSPLSTDPTMIQMSQSGYGEEAAIK